MVGRGGGKKTSNCSIPPGRLQSCIQNRGKHLTNQPNIGGVNNNNNLAIEDEIATMVCRNLRRQRTYFTNTEAIELPILNDHGARNGDEIEDHAPENDPNLVDNALNDQLSEGVIASTHERLLTKRKNRSNFVSRIEEGLQINEALDPRPRKIIIRNDPEQANGDVIDETTATSKTKGVGKRGMYKSYVVDMKIKGKGSKLRISIPDDIDRAIGENARHLVNECGRVVRTKAPMNVKSWKEAFAVAGDSMLKEIQDKFEVAESSDYLRMHMFILETMQRLYRLYKCRLHYYYKSKKCGNTDDERKKNPPPDLPQSQWEYLIKYYGSDEFKLISARNSKNRNSDKRVKHTTGQLSFPESEDVLTKKNGGVKLSANKVWLIQHTRKNDDGKLEWLHGDTRSKEIHEKLKNVVASVGNSLTHEEILMQVLGQRSGYIRGKGTGVRAYVKGKAAIEQCKIVEQQQEKIQLQEQKIKDLEGKIKEYKTQQQEAMEAFRQSILQQLQVTMP